ncbi:FAD-binding oxidoreductase [Pontibacter silvestris]|uniref:FAD-binding oxidoreductase n=1 Tax=Pontibacter silvestris TaxID=2305183 RepID=A0ABW4WS59_9BACT|nr:ferredoxin--NADP reductase [Pontibacter silvestris]MCC9136293.1 ferredoxin--NADP reductase [Pontibacter silvestris]
MSSQYYNLKVVEITQETADAVTLHLEHPAKQIIDYKPGQFLTLILSINGKKIRRSYSLSSTPQEAPRLSVTVKRVNGGLVSNHLLNNVRVGENIEVMEPIGNFCLNCETSNIRNIILFGAGSGITPLISILKAVLREEPQSRVTLLYGNRNKEAVIFSEQLKQLEEANQGRLHVEYIYSQPQSNQPKKKLSLLERLKLVKPKEEEPVSLPTQDNEHHGRMNQSMVIKILERLQLTKPVDALYYMCGPEGMMDEVDKALKVLHVPAERVFRESFVSSKLIQQDQEEHHGDVSATADDGEIKTQTVKLIYEGAEYNVEVKPNQTILEAGLEQNIDLPYSCQAGLCTACRGKCLSGKVHLDEREGLSEAELEEGYVLNCVGHPLTNDVIIEIG